MLYINLKKVRSIQITVLETNMIIRIRVCFYIVSSLTLLITIDETVDINIHCNCKFVYFDTENCRLYNALDIRHEPDKNITKDAN